MGTLFVQRAARGREREGYARRCSWLQFSSDAVWGDGGIVPSHGVAQVVPTLQALRGAGGRRPRDAGLLVRHTKCSPQLHLSVFRAARLMHQLLRVTGILALLTANAGCKDVCDGGGEIPAISSAEYDRSCNVDADCVSVPEGNICDACALHCLQLGAVNKRVEAQYRKDVADLVKQFPKSDCRCPATPDPCCLDRVCRHDVSCVQH